VSRLVAQGNRSFTNHRGLHEHAWDFWTWPLRSNVVTIEHEDGARAMYAHIRHASAAVRLSFADVPDGVPRAGRFYVSGNER
jgi:hypothetical protein